jgi:hypothetical protein
VHIQKQRDCKLDGNIGFASRNAFKRVSLSRRDDLLSLCNVLVYLVEGQRAWEAKFLENSSLSLQKQISDSRIRMRPSRLCSDASRVLLPFVEEVYKLRFTETPNY